MFLRERKDKRMVKKPKLTDSWEKKNVYFDMEHMRIVGQAARKIVCPECCGVGKIPWADKPKPDEYDICSECEGKGEWVEPDF